MASSAEIARSGIQFAGTYRSACRRRTWQVVIDWYIASSGDHQSFCALIVGVYNPTALKTAGCAGGQHCRSDAITHIFQNVDGLRVHTRWV